MDLPGMNAGASKKHRTKSGYWRIMLGCAVTIAWCSALGQNQPPAPDPVLGPNAVPSAPALGPDATPTSPALSPDQTNPAPVLQPGAVPADPALAPGAVPNRPALSPDQTNPEPVLAPERSDSLAPLSPIYPGSNQ